MEALTNKQKINRERKYLFRQTCFFLYIVAMNTNRLHIISGLTEHERRLRLFAILKEHNLNPEQIVYLTLNRRKRREVIDTFRNEFPQGTFLPEVRTLRGFFDRLVEKYRPDIRIIGAAERHFIIRQLCRSSQAQSQETALATDLETTLHLCGQYGIPLRSDHYHTSGIPESVIRIIAEYNSHLNALGARDYAALPFSFFDESHIPQNDWKSYCLILDGFYWLYPAEQNILNHIIPLFGTTLWLEDDILSAEHRNNAEYFHLPVQIADLLKIPAKPDNSPPDIPGLILQQRNRFSFNQCPTPMGEVRQLTAEILSLLQEAQLSPEDITVVTASADYLPTIEHLFRYHGIPYDAGRGRPLTALPVYSYFTDFLSLPVAEFPIKSLLNLLKLFQNGRADKFPSFLRWHAAEIEIFEEWCRWSGMTTARQLDFSFDALSWVKSLDPADTDFLPDSWAIFADEPSFLEQKANYLTSALHKVQNFIHFFNLKKYSETSWINFISTVFQYFRDLPDFSESLHRSQQHYKDFMNTLPRLFHGLPNSPQSYAEWLEITLYQLSHTEIRDERGKGIRVLEKLETRGLSGRQLFVLGASRQNLPGRLTYPELFRQIISEKKASDPALYLFPAHLEADYLLQFFLLNFDSVTFFWPRQNKGQITGPAPSVMTWFAHMWNKEKGTKDFSPGDLINQYTNLPAGDTENPLLFNQELKPVHTVVFTNRTILLRLRKQNAVQESHWYNGLIGVSSLWKQLAGGLTRTAAERVWSPSSLETLSTCPMKFFFRYGLHVVPTASGSGSSHKRLMGRLIHRILENACNDSELLELRKSGVVIDDTHPALEKALKTAFQSMERVLEQTHPFADPILEGLKLRFRQQRFLEYWVQADNKLMADYGQPVMDIRTEVALQADIPDIPLTIRGRIDRMDILENTVRFYDYKTGSSATGYAKRQQQGLYWQFILYSYLLQEEFSKLSIFPGGYIFSTNIRNNRMQGILNRKEFDAFFHLLAENRSHFVSRLHRLMEVVENAHFYSSVIKESDAWCPNCDYRNLCYRSSGYSLKEFCEPTRQQTLITQTQSSSHPIYLPFPVELSEDNAI